jgi:hypothetical protein
MNEQADFITPKRESAAVHSDAPFPAGEQRRSGAALSPDQARLQELEAANARLLKLVGELLVANQKLRERTAL